MIIKNHASGGQRLSAPTVDQITNAGKAEHAKTDRKFYKSDKQRPEFKFHLDTGIV